MIERELLSGLWLRRFQKPLAGMVVRGSGPNLIHELEARDSKLVFLAQICSIILPIRVVAFSLPLTGLGLAQPCDQAAVAVAGVR